MLYRHLNFLARFRRDLNSQRRGERCLPCTFAWSFTKPCGGLSWRGEMARRGSPSFATLCPKP